VVVALHQAVIPGRVLNPSRLRRLARARGPAYQDRSPRRQSAPRLRL